jgi:hypothetical protein
MARDPRQGSSGSAPERPRALPDARQGDFGEVEGDDGWTLIGGSDEPAAATPEAEPVPASDVAAAPELQFESDPEPQSPSVPEQEAELDRGLLGEAAAVPPERSFDPFAVEVAVDPPRPSSPPVEAPRPSAGARTPVHRSALPATLAAIALLGLGALAWRNARVVRALEDDLAAQRALVPAAQAVPPQTAAELAGLRARVEQLEGELAEVAQRDAARASEAQARATALGTERDVLAAQLAAARSDLQQAESRAAQSQARVDALGAELERARQAASAPALGPAERRAEVCESVLGRIEAGQGAAARAQLEAGFTAGLFAQGARDGGALLVELAAAAEALERALGEGATGGAPAAALEAHEHLHAARAALPGFAAEAADWLARDSGGGAAADPLERAVRVERSLAGLESQAAGLGVGLDDLHAAHWTVLLARGPAQDPGPALEHAGRFGCAHPAELARAAAGHLREECMPAGTPEVERLLAAECLPAWAASLGAQAQRGEAELELLWLDAARRWYAAGAPAVGFEWHGLEPPPVPERARDWRAELWLRVQLAAPDSAWPPRPGEAALYQLSGPSRARWRSDRRIDDGQGAGWTWLRTHFDEHGATLGEPERVAVELAGDRARLAEAELVLLDLRAAQPGCEVAPAPVPPIGAPPGPTGFGQRAVLAHAAEATRSTCLVVPQGDTTRWFSPRLGLMLEEHRLASGAARVELCVREAAP